MGDSLDREVAAAVRRLVWSNVKAWSPLLIGVLVVSLVLAFVSPVSNGTNGGGSRIGTSAAGVIAQGGNPAATLAQGASPQVAGTGGVGTSPTGAGQALAAGGGGTTPSPAGSTAAVPAPGTPGVTVEGVACGPGVRQVPWSVYAPWCVPAWHGDNGGATSHGVTATTITLTYRLANATQQTMINSVGGDAVPQDQPYIHDMQTYIGLFNRTFELYGRHVVLVPFQGQGNYLDEDYGQSLPGAEADAATSYGLGAFGDATFVLTSSQPYEQDLAQQRIISFSPTGEPDSWMRQYSPYEWSVFRSGTRLAQAFYNLACQRMAGMPAIFAGNGTAGKKRVFGLIAPDTPTYQEEANEVVSGLSSCGVHLASRLAYSLDVTSFESQSTSMVAQLKAAGVTTAICECDPLLPIFLTQAADQQQYYPEWLAPSYLDPAARVPSQDQMAHTLSVDFGAWPARSSAEDYHAFELADPGGAPAEQYFGVGYFTLLQIFDALEAAGPDLTPGTFAKGMASLPTSGLGEFGTWQFAPNASTPNDYTQGINTQIGWWAPGAVSNFDGKKGAWENCDGGAWYTYADPASYAPAHTQLSCFGH